jgi:hypothetical protein
MSFFGPKAHPMYENVHPRNIPLNSRPADELKQCHWKNKELARVNMARPARRRGGSARGLLLSIYSVVKDLKRGERQDGASRGRVNILGSLSDCRRKRLARDASR